MATSLSSNLTQRQYAAIGKIACEWSYVEQSLQEMLWIVADVPPEKGLKISTELGAVTLLNMTLALAQDGHFEQKHQPPIYHAIFGISETINTLRGRRNYYVHKDWIRRGRTEFIETIHFKADGKLVGRIAEATAEKMEGVAADMRALNKKIEKIKKNFKAGTLVASPSISKRQRGRDRQLRHASSGKTLPSQP